MNYINAILAIFISGFVIGQVNPNSRYQRGYVKKGTETYVQPHFKTHTNKTNHDN